MLDPHTCHTLLIYGGSFDPPHRAHIDGPLAACAAIGADGVLYVPAGQPPHKPDRIITPSEHRLAMLRLALHDHPKTAIETWELNRPAPSYTIETLEHLSNTLGSGVTLRLLIGADMAAIFETWRDPEKIESLAEPCVMRRPGEAFALEHHPRWRDRIVETPQIDISSTTLRQALRAGDFDSTQVKQNLDPAVLQYIRTHGLYRNSNRT